MLRNRSRAVTGKQAIMTDNSSLPSPTQKAISSFLGSPKFFGGLLAKSLFDAENIVSPHSIVQEKHFSDFNYPFGYDQNLSKPLRTMPENKQSDQKRDSKAIGLALIDSLIDGKPDDNFSKTSRMILFGSKLNIQIPPLAPSLLAPAESPKSPADFGIKTRNSQILGSLSAFSPVNSHTHKKESPQALTGHLSLSEMELSEDYTCVISHGPNPKTTHIYDNCIVESCCGVVGFSELKKEYGFSLDNSKSPPEDFLSLCHTCKKDLAEGKDI